MKAIKVILSLILMVLFSCSKKEENCYLNMCIDWEEYSSQSISNDSNIWQADHCWFGDLNNGKTVIHMNFNNQFGELRENIRVQNFNIILGKTSLHYQRGGTNPLEGKPTAYFDTFAGDGDAATEFYDLYDKEGFENYLKINSISDDGLEIEGEYQLYFVISQDSPSKFDETRPDTLIFTDGIFKARKLE